MDNNTVNANALQQMLLQLRNSFLDGLPEKFNHLETLILTIEKNGQDSEAFDEFYRVVHSLKGSGGTHGLHIITTVCHQLEDLLNTTVAGTKYTPKLIAASLDYIDLLRLSTELILKGDSSYSQIEERLIQLQKQLSTKQFTALIVDNSKLSTHIILESLAQLPIRPVVMTDGYLALMRALTEPFDLLITTNEIPGLNGIALIGALKLSDSNNRNIKTVLITSKKSIATHVNRDIDADCIIIKDANLAQNLIDSTKSALSITEHI